MHSAFTYRSPFRPSTVNRWLRTLFFRGQERFCCVCDSEVSKFGPYGHKVRQDVRCPICGCVERHRLTWRFFKERTNLFEAPKKKMMHVAPEPAFERQLRSCAQIDYLTVDAQDEGVDQKVDLQALPFAGGAFDVVHCSHVLEHVADDRKAMRELARVLSPRGWAMILVPIWAEKSFEDPTIISSEERARVYGQWDHVRIYGPDFEDRLIEAGFVFERVIQGVRETHACAVVAAAVPAP